MTTQSKLVAFSKEQPARLLTHYLIEQGIQAEYSHLDNEYSHAVIVFESADYLTAKSIAEEFILDPNNIKYQTAAWQSGEAVELKPTRSYSAAAKVLWEFKQVPLTAIILLSCIFLFIFDLLRLDFVYSSLKIQSFSTLVESHQWWRIFGPTFFHGSILHISFNLGIWWALAKQIESSFGVSSLFLLFIFSAAISNICQLLMTGPNFKGLSGVVYALVGCFWWLGWLRPSWKISLPQPIIVFMLFWLLIGYLDILPVHMANTAHTVGLICGCLFACFLVSKADIDIAK